MAQSMRRPTPIVYCLIPADLANKLHEPLRRHFSERSDVEVIVERRELERRAGAGRRSADTGTDRAAAGPEAEDADGEQIRPPGGKERRQVIAALGRRAGERRASQARASAPPDLPRAARRHAGRIRFVRRLEPPTQHAEDIDTARLVARFQAGERELFAILYQRYFDRVYRYLRTILSNHHEAEDTAQEVFTRVLEALPKYERRKQPFRAWLFVVARNAAIDALARAGRLELLDPEELRRVYEERASGDENETELGALGWITDRDLSLFVDRLPVPQQQVLVLRYVVDLPEKHIATILGRSAADVRMLHSRAVRFLRSRLEALDRAPKRAPNAKMRRSPRHATVLRSRRWALDP